jgi:MFS family permease
MRTVRSQGLFAAVRMLAHRVMNAAMIKTPESPLGYREYRELWTANASSNFGSQVQVVGATWLMASLTNSPQLIAMVQTAINLPTVFFILAGGAMADNFDRRRIMLLTQSGMFAVAMLLAGLSWYHLVTPWLLLALTFTISGLSSVNNPAWQSSVRDILPRDMISRAVALNSMSINLARTAGPALGGIVVTVAGAAVAFLINALSFVAFIVALIRWAPVRKPRTTPRERILPAMAAGIRYASLAPHLRNTVVRGGLSSISASAAFALLPVVARQEMDGNALLYGMLLAAFGFGAVISAYIGGKLRSKLTPDQVVRIATSSLAIGLATLALAPNPVIAGIGAALSGSGWVMTHSTYNTTVQLTTPQWVTGRSLALYQTATFAGMAVGSLLFGWIAEHYDVSSALLIASGGQILAGLVAFALPLPRLDEMKVDPLDLWKPPQFDEEIGTDEGPIFVELEYAIPAENKAAFLTAMRHRERIRKRDGARDWSLWQDLQYRDRWIESYHVPTWGDYLRHNSRRTVADLENTQMLNSLNIDPAGPTVRRYRKNPKQ